MLKLASGCSLGNDHDLEQEMAEKACVNERQQHIILESLECQRLLTVKHRMN